MPSDSAIKLQNTKGIIWDLDNTLYKSDHVVYDLINQTMAELVVEMGADIDIETASKIAEQSFLDHGRSSVVFSQDYGLCDRTIYFEVHRRIQFEPFIEKCHHTIDLLDRLHPLPQMILTHASKEWAERMLMHLGLKDFFPDEKIIALEDTDFVQKNESEKPFDMALDMLGTAKSETIIVEDSLKNLKIPHEMGLGTVFIHHGQIPDPLPKFVHFTTNSVPTFLEKLLAEQGK